MPLMVELKLTPRIHLNMFGGSLGDPRGDTSGFVNISKPQGYKSQMSTITVVGRFMTTLCHGREVAKNKCHCVKLLQSRESEEGKWLYPACF